MLQRNHPVRRRKAALEALLGQHDRRTVVLVQAPQLRQQLLGGNRVQLRGGLVQQQQAGPCRKRRSKRDALKLTAGQGPDGALEQIGDAECERRFLDRARERRAAHAAALERQLDLRAHAVHHGLRLRVLEHEGDRVGELPGPLVARVAPPHAHVTCKRPAEEVGRETAGGPQQRRLAAARAARKHDHLPLAEGEGHVVAAPARCALGYV